MTPLKLGVIGLSDGNGHPYSWSAIFNGYDPVHMDNCGFPVISSYLAKQHFPKDSINEAKVTHVWAQSNEIATHIAKATLIPNIVENYTNMIGEIDGLLLARDDAETHLVFATPFLNAGIPIYIDKPLALNVLEAEKLINMQCYPGQIFSCSALRFAKEFKLSITDWMQIGHLRQIHAMSPKEWDKYAIHVIEPMLLIANESGSIESTKAWQQDDSTTLAVKYKSGLQFLITTTGTTQAPITLRVMGDSGWKDLFFQDTFFTFKTALFEFVQGIIHRDVRISTDSMLKVISIIELGRVDK